MTKPIHEIQQKAAAFKATYLRSISEVNNRLNHNDTSINNQHAICLSALALSPQSTIDLRHTFGVMMPAARVKELRTKGFDIVTVRVTETTPDNISHKGVAKYVLRQRHISAIESSEVVA